MKTLSIQLTTEELNEIRRIIRLVPSIKNAVIFGSRAMFKAKNGSDVDIALLGDIDLKDCLTISMNLNEETTMPYYFDVLVYNQIKNSDLINHINNCGVNIF